MSGSSSFVLVTALVGVVIGALLPPKQYKEEEVGKFVVAVVGKGVPEDPSKCPGPPVKDEDSKIGWAMWNGACAANLQPPASVFELRPINDFNSDLEHPEEAEKVALGLREDPRVLAVVGHAASGATQQAAALYADAGIPSLCRSPQQSRRPFVGIPGSGSRTVSDSH